MDTVPGVRPIAVLSFDRPHYLEQVLRSLKAQTATLASGEVALFQDGYRSKSGHDLTDPRLIERCLEMFCTVFPGGTIFTSAENLGVALNFERAERYVFSELGADVAYFFEDDLVLSPHYLMALQALTDLALRDSRIGYVAAYGDHRATLEKQRETPHKLILMGHKWGFALTRRQWLAQREIMQPYLDIVRRTDYRARDHAAIQEYFGKLGYGSPGTSQDAMKDVASCILGSTKIMTFPCFGKYIGEIGLHSNKQRYDEARYGETVLYPGAIGSFEPPSDAALEKWIALGRAHARAALRDLYNASLPPRGAPAAQPSGSPEEKFIRALYRVLFRREVDPAGLHSALSQLRDGRSYEELIVWCLRSKEFAEKSGSLLRTYVHPSPPVDSQRAGDRTQAVPANSAAHEPSELVDNATLQSLGMPFRVFAETTIKLDRDGQPLLGRTSDWDANSVDKGHPLFIVVKDRYFRHYFHSVETLIALHAFANTALRGHTVGDVYFGDVAFSNPAHNNAQRFLLSALFPDARLPQPNDTVSAANVLLFDRSLCKTTINKLLEPLQAMAIDCGADFQRAVWDFVGVTHRPVENREGKPRALYVTRQPPRCLSAADERFVMSALETMFVVETVDFAQMPWPKQVESTFGCRLLVGVHGNGLTNLCWLKKDATVLEFFPLNTHHYDYQILCEIFSLDYWGIEGSYVFRPFTRTGPAYGHGQAVALHRPTVARAIENSLMARR
jgi:hypothetical protein